MYNFGTGPKINWKLGQDLKLGKEIMNLVFCAWGYMKPGLLHNWHVQVVHKLFLFTIVFLGKKEKKYSRNLSHFENENKIRKRTR